MKYFIILISLIINLNCYANASKESFQDFLKCYYNSKERYLWGEVIYAIENDYSDDIIILCLKKFGLQKTIYTSRNEYIDLENKEISWGKDKSPVEVKNILITCVRNNKINIFEILLNYFPDNQKKFISEYRFEYYTDGYNYIPAYLDPIANIIIKESENPIDYLNILVKNLDNENQLQLFNYASNKNTYPIELAFRKLDYELIKFMIDNKSRYDVYIDGNSLFYFSTKNKRYDISELLLEINNGYTTSYLFDSILLKDKDAVILCLNYGADPLKSYNKYNRIMTPLELAQLLPLEKRPGCLRPGHFF